MLNKSDLNSTTTAYRDWNHDSRSYDSKNRSSKDLTGDNSQRKIDPNSAGNRGDGGKKTLDNPDATAPTVSEFLDASAAEYTQGQTAGDLVPVTYGNGKPVTGENIGDGMYASLWWTPQGKIIVSFEGTSGETPTGQNQDLLKAQQSEDTDISNGKVTNGERDAVNFTHWVTTTAAKYGIASDKIFVTGHSLGAIQAEYVAQQTGLGGMGFEPTGLPPSTTGVGNGNNFVDVLTHGDPVGFDASDVKGEQPVAPPYVAGGGSLPHYGKLLMIGDPSQDGQLTSDADNEVPKVASGQMTLAQAVGDLLESRAPYHVLATDAYNLGVSVSPSIAGGVGNGMEFGPVDDVGNDTLSQLLQSLS